MFSLTLVVNLGSMYIFTLSMETHIAVSPEFTQAAYPRRDVGPTSQDYSADVQGHILNALKTFFFSQEYCVKM